MYLNPRVLQATPSGSPRNCWLRNTYDEYEMRIDGSSMRRHCQVVMWGFVDSPELDGQLYGSRTPMGRDCKGLSCWSTLAYGKHLPKPYTGDPVHCRSPPTSLARLSK